MGIKKIAAKLALSAVQKELREIFVASDPSGTAKNVRDLVAAGLKSMKDETLHAMVTKSIVFLDDRIKAL